MKVIIITLAFDPDLDLGEGRIEYELEISFCFIAKSIKLLTPLFSGNLISLLSNRCWREMFFDRQLSVSYYYFKKDIYNPRDVGGLFL